MRVRNLTVVLIVVSFPCLSKGQEVFFDVSPLSTVPINTPPDVTDTPPIVVVQPGDLVPYELGVFVQLTPAFPNLNGLGAFDLNLLTTLGRLQPPLGQFEPQILESFTVLPGTPFGDDVLGIAGGQDLSGITASGVGQGRRQIIGTGQLVTPLTEGDFEITVIGTADVLNTAINPFSPVLQPANVGLSRGFIIQTREDANGTPTTQPVDDNELNDFGASLVNICFPGVAVVVPVCMFGLMGMRWCFRGKERTRERTDV
jgi:hypothetical protein